MAIDFSMRVSTKQITVRGTLSVLCVLNVLEDQYFTLTPVNQYIRSSEPYSYHLHLKARRKCIDPGPVFVHVVIN